MPAPPESVGSFRLARELVERQWLSRTGVKIPIQFAYVHAWVLSKEEAGKWQPVKYFETEEEAREWAQAQGAN